MRFSQTWGGPLARPKPRRNLQYCMVNVFLQRHSKRGYESIWIYPEYIPEDVSPPWFPNHLWGIPSTIQQNSSDWGDKNWYPSYKSDDMDPAVPFPVHVQGIKSWASTKIKLKKWRGKDLSYHEFIMKVFNHDAPPPRCVRYTLPATLQARLRPSNLHLPPFQVTPATCNLLVQGVD